MSGAVVVAPLSLASPTAMSTSPASTDTPASWPVSPPVGMPVGVAGEPGLLREEHPIPPSTRNGIKTTDGRIHDLRLPNIASARPAALHQRARFCCADSTLIWHLSKGASTPRRAELAEPDEPPHAATPR